MGIRDLILAKDDLKTEKVHVAEWDMDLTIKTLTGTERDKFEASTVQVSKSGQARQNLENLRSRLIVLCVIDPNDSNLPVFTAKDIPLLGAKSAAALDTLFAACQKLNGFTKEDVEELVQGFDSDPSESSISD